MKEKNLLQPFTNLFSGSSKASSYQEMTRHPPSQTALAATTRIAAKSATQPKTSGGAAHSLDNPQHPPLPRQTRERPPLHIILPFTSSAPIPPCRPRRSRSRNRAAQPDPRHIQSACPFPHIFRSVIAVHVPFPATIRWEAPDRSVSSAM